MKIVVDDKIPFLEGVLEPFVDVEYYPGKDITRDKIIDAEALIIRTRTKCNSGLLEGTSVKFIATATIGFDHIDADYCARNGIKWTNAPGCNSGSVMQYIAAILLFWAHKNSIKLENRVLGVIGVGNVGSKVVKLAEILGMQVLLNDPPFERNSGACGFISLNGLLRESDIISLHVPLNMDGQDKTFHLIDESFLDKLNPGSLLINSSRGEVVDTNSMLSAYNSGKPKYFVFDVWENEPEINPEVLSNSYIGTSHIAGYSADGKANGTKMSVQAVSKFFNLGIDNWEPDNVPSPLKPIIEVCAGNKSFQEIATEVILHTYPIERDSNSLKNYPDKFETHRGEYPLRREFTSYTINAKDLSDDFARRFRKLGFKVISI